MSRVASTLITGSAGEIGHALIGRLAAAGRQVVTLDLNPLAPDPRQTRSPGVHRVNPRRRVARPHPRRVRGRLPLPPRGVALDPWGVLARARPQGQRRGDAELAGVRPACRRVARPEGDVLLPVEHRRLRPARPRHEGGGRPRPRGRLQRADHHVRREQALLRTPWPLLRAALQATLGRAAGGPGGLPRAALPRPAVGGDGPVGRHVGLRPGDAARGGPGPALRLLRAAPTRASRL